MSRTFGSAYPDRQKPVFVQQADATLSQANPVSTTLYTVLATAANVRILSIHAQVTWTVQPSPLEIVVTIDGISTIFGVVNPVSNTRYFASTEAYQAAADQTLETTDRQIAGRGVLLEGRSVKVEARTTGGTVSNLTARVKYARMT